jgi:hypothetical protein
VQMRADKQLLNSRMEELEQQLRISRNALECSRTAWVEDHARSIAAVKQLRDLLNDREGILSVLRVEHESMKKSLREKEAIYEGIERTIQVCGTPCAGRYWHYVQASSTTFFQTAVFDHYMQA